MTTEIIELEPWHHHHHSNQLLCQMAKVSERIHSLRGETREFYYRVMLFQKPCPQCGGTDLVMHDEDGCQCQTCSHTFDPTLAFQQCPACDGTLIQKVCHYWCAACHRPVNSLYAFEAKVFDDAYFREMMRLSRQRKQERLERVRHMLAGSRSDPLTVTVQPESVELSEFLAELDTFVAAPVSVETFLPSSQPIFEMEVYRRYVQDMTDGCSILFEGMRQMIEDPRLDRIYRFIAVIFMAHAGEIQLDQDPDGRLLVRGT